MTLLICFFRRIVLCFKRFWMNRWKFDHANSRRLHRWACKRGGVATVGRGKKTIPGRKNQRNQRKYAVLINWNWTISFSSITRASEDEKSPARHAAVSYNHWKTFIFIKQVSTPPMLPHGHGTQRTRRGPQGPPEDPYCRVQRAVKKWSVRVGLLVFGMINTSKILREREREFSVLIKSLTD